MCILSVGYFKPKDTVLRVDSEIIVESLGKFCSKKKRNMYNFVVSLTKQIPYK